MAKRHTHKFEVEISYVGNIHDFDWFFKKRRRNVLDVCNVKEIDHTIVKVQPSAEQIDATTQQKIAKKVLSECLKAAGFALVNQDKVRQSETNAAFIGDHQGGYVVRFSHHSPNYSVRCQEGQLKLWYGPMPYDTSSATTATIEMADPKSFEQLTEIFKRCLKKTLTPSSK